MNEDFKFVDHIRNTLAKASRVYANVSQLSSQIYNILLKVYPLNT